MAAQELDVLVCVKRVPESSSEITLTGDGQAVDGRYVGFTTSDHEQCAVEAAVQLVAEEGGGSVTVLTLGPAEAVDQLRAALAVGATAATHVVADSSTYGPADVAREIAEVIRAHEVEGRPHDLVLLGNDAADSGDFQVGIRLAHVLGRPVVNGMATLARDTSGGDAVVARGNGPDGEETYRVPLPAVVTVLEGGVSPRYPSMTGRVKAKKVTIEERTPVHEPAGPSRVRLTLPPPAPSQVQVLGEGAAAAPAMVDLLHELGVGR